MRKNFRNSGDLISEFIVSLKTLKELQKVRSTEDISRYFKTFSRHPSIFVSENLLRNLTVRSGGKIFLEPLGIRSGGTKCAGIEVRKKQFTSDQLRNYLRQLTVFGKVVLNTDCSVDTKNNVRCRVKLMPEACKYHAFDEQQLEEVDIAVIEDEAESEAENLKEDEYKICFNEATRE